MHAMKVMSVCVLSGLIISGTFWDDIKGFSVNRSEASWQNDPEPRDFKTITRDLGIPAKDLVGFTIIDEFPNGEEVIHFVNTGFGPVTVSKIIINQRDSCIIDGTINSITWPLNQLELPRILFPNGIPGGQSKFPMLLNVGDSITLLGVQFQLAARRCGSKIITFEVFHEYGSTKF